MKVGLSTYDIDAGDLVDLARCADAAGFESLWLGEHVILPVGFGSEHPTSSGPTVQHHTGPIIDPTTRLIDPLISLGAAGAVTHRIRLATGVYLAPLRHPILIARSVATVQQLAGGRFMLGLGAGWLAEEFEAVGIPFVERSRRLGETIDAIRSLFAGGAVEHRGESFSFGPVMLQEHAVEVPIVLGGNGDAALRRAARVADGWFSSGTPLLDEALALRDRLDDEASRCARSQPLDQWFRAPFVDVASLAGHEREGFERVVVWADQLWPTDGPSDERGERFVDALKHTGLDELLTSDNEQRAAAR